MSIFVHFIAFSSDAYLWKCSLIRSSRVLSGKFATQRWRVSRTILHQLIRIHGGGLHARFMVYRNGTHTRLFTGLFYLQFFLYIFSVTKFRTDKYTFFLFWTFFSSVILTDATAYLFDFFLIFFPLSLFLLFIFWHVKYFFLLIHACNLQHKHSHWKIFFFFFFFKHFWSKILPIYISLTFISSSSSATAAFLPSNHSDTSGYIHIKL